MSVASERLHRTHKPTFAELYSPKLLTVLREGYDAADFRADLIAGLTVAIVALPLSMAIAIASGVTPDRGLYTAVVGGFIVLLLGGSRMKMRFDETSWVMVQTPARTGSPATFS